MRFIQSTLYSKFTFPISFQTKQLVWNKSIDKVKRNLIKPYSSIKISGSFRLIGTLNCCHILTLISQNAIYIMRTIALRHIDKFRPNIAHRTFLIDKVINLQIRRNRKFFLCLNNVEVTIHDARNIRHIRNDAQNLIQVEFTQTDRYILQCVLIFIIRIDSHAHTTRSSQQQISRYSLVIREHQVIISISLKLLIAKNWMRIRK